MEIGFVTDGLGFLPFAEMLETIVSLGVTKLEIPCGPWSSAPHLKLDELVSSKGARDDYRDQVRAANADIVALNCSGNQLAPGSEGERSEAVVRKTFALAEAWGIRKIVMTSGLPAAPGDKNPSWIVTSWPPAATEILSWQWNEVVIPYWRETVRRARDHGIECIALENCAFQIVYNVETLLRLRDAAGEMVGMNLDPSHMFWMGADPIEAARTLSGAIHHVHAKDCRIERGIAGVNGVLDPKTAEHFARRAWNYVALGYGHGEQWWREFLVVVRMAGYDGVISIEQEDLTMPAIVGVQKAVSFLRSVLPDHLPQGDAAPRR
jgi:sugar phosphate isomerase/epimerase